MSANLEIHRFKLSIIAAFRGGEKPVESVTQAMEAAVDDAVGRHGREAGKLSASLDDLIPAAIEAVEETGGDLGRTAKGMALGISHSPKLPAGVAVEILQVLGERLIEWCLREEADLANTMQGYIEGIAQGIKEKGLRSPDQYDFQGTLIEKTSAADPEAGNFLRKHFGLGEENRKSA